jgi:glucose-1-phosphate cytidylyltransferase
MKMGAQMKAVILAGGRGTRLSEETLSKPKPLVEAAGQPLLWHIMQNYHLHGVNEFIILAGYKAQLIREYFNNFWLHQSDVTFDLGSPNHEIIRSRTVPWKVSVLDTGLDSGTGTRLRYLLGNLNEDFLLTYGDGVADVDITNLVAAHNSSNKDATLTAVQPPARFGALNLRGDEVVSFEEKPNGEGAWINGGFFVLSPKILSKIPSTDCSFEFDVLPQLAQNGNLNSYKHNGFWQPVDTLRDLQRLEEEIGKKSLPWLKEI